MSIHVMNLVWKKSHNKRTAMLLLLAIADHAHDDGGGAFPSVETLARKTRQTERNVQLLLNTLEASKELKIRVGEGPHGCNLYQININLLESYSDWEVPDIGEEAESDTESSLHKISPPKTFRPENSREENAENFTGGAKNSAESARQISPEPSVNPHLTTNEPSGDGDFSEAGGFSKSGFQNEIKSLFFVHSEFDWSWMDALALEIPYSLLWFNTIHRLFDLGSSRHRNSFDPTGFTRMLRAAHARKEKARP